MSTPFADILIVTFRYYAYIKKQKFALELAVETLALMGLEDTIGNMDVGDLYEEDGDDVENMGEEAPTTMDLEEDAEDDAPRQGTSTGTSTSTHPQPTGQPPATPPTVIKWTGEITEQLEASFRDLIDRCVNHFMLDFCRFLCYILNYVVVGSYAITVTRNVGSYALMSFIAMVPYTRSSML